MQLNLTDQSVLTLKQTLGCSLAESTLLVKSSSCVHLKQFAERLHDKDFWFC